MDGRWEGMENHKSVLYEKKMIFTKRKNIAINYFLCIQDPVTRTVYSLVAERRELSVCPTPLRKEEYIGR